jgi:pimeloyl-ACP methyl ester carboxylesterase
MGMAGRGSGFGSPSGVVTVPNAGHNIPFAHFEEFMPILRQFLKQSAAVAS